MKGIPIFATVAEALRAGYEMETRFPDSEGFLIARTIRKPHARALVRPSLGF